MKAESQVASTNFRDTVDRLEREFNLDLARIEAEAFGNGIALAHPDFNYHVSHGSTVCFENWAIDISLLSISARHAIHSLEILSLIQALEIVRVARNLYPGECEALIPKRKEIVDAGLFGLYPIVDSLLASGRSERGIFEPNEFGKWGLNFWRSMADQSPAPPLCPFKMITPKV